MSCISDFYGHENCCYLTTIMVGALLGFGAALSFVILYLQMWLNANSLGVSIDEEVTDEMQEPQEIGYLCQIDGSDENYGETIVLIMQINWIIYGSIALICMLNCCGGFVLFCRNFGGCMHLIPGIMAHIFVVAYLGVFLYNPDTQYCATEGNGQTE